MNKTLLAEATSAATATETPGLWEAVLITPGQGSSGFYEASVLEKYGPVAFRAGAKSFVTHNRLENGEPDPFQMWGYLAEDARWEEGRGLVGKIQVLESWRDKVEEVAPHTALSVYVAGEVDDDGNIVELFEDVMNGVDMVVYPGRPGSALVQKMYEAAIASASGTASAEADNEMKEHELDEIKELLEGIRDELSAQAEKISGLQESVDGLVALSESNSEAAEVVEEAGVLAKALVEAELPEKAVERVIEAVKGGKVASDAIASEKAYVDELRENLNEGHAAGSGGNGGFSLKELK